MRTPDAEDGLRFLPRIATALSTITIAHRVALAVPDRAGWAAVAIGLRLANRALIVRGLMAERPDAGQWRLT